MLKTCFGSLPVSDEADEVELRYFGGRDTRAQVFDVKDPVMRCGVEGSQVSDGGDSHVFTFGCRISDFFFPSVHGLRTVLLQGCGSLFSFCC